MTDKPSATDRSLGMLAAQLRGIAEHLRSVPEYHKLRGDADIIEQAMHALHASVSAGGGVHPDNIEVMIDSLVSVVRYDMRPAAEKDLRALVEMARLSVSPQTKPHVPAKCEACGYVESHDPNCPKPRPTMDEWIEELDQSGEHILLPHVAEQLVDFLKAIRADGFPASPSHGGSNPQPPTDDEIKEALLAWEGAIYEDEHGGSDPAKLETARADLLAILKRCKDWRSAITGGEK